MTPLSRGVRDKLKTPQHWKRTSVCKIILDFKGYDLTFRGTPHEKRLGILSVSNPATSKDLADRFWGGSGTNPK